MNEAVVFSQPLDLLVISGSGLKVGVVSQKIPPRKRTPPFIILDPPLNLSGNCVYKQPVSLLLVISWIVYKYSIFTETISLHH